MNDRVKKERQKHFARNLREYRESFNWTQEDLAAQCPGIGGATAICRYERGIANPRLLRIHELADALNCTIYDLI